MKQKKKLLLDLYRVALGDGHLSREEMDVLENYCKKNELDLDEIVRLASSTPFELPKEDNEKKEYLKEVARMIIADEVIKEEEVYLFDRIIMTLEMQDDIDQLRDEIFQEVVMEYIRKKTQELENLQKTILEDLHKKVMKTTRSDGITLEAHRIIIQQLQDFIREKENLSPLSIRILLLGVSKMDKGQIKNIIKEKLGTSNYELLDKNITICKEYDKIKSFFPAVRDNMKLGVYNLFIYGPGPHKLKGKEGDGPWERFFENTDTFVKGKYDKPISKDFLEQALDDFLLNSATHNFQ